MEEFLTYRTLDNKQDFEKVPASLKDEVKYILVDIWKADLAK